MRFLPILFLLAGLAAIAWWSMRPRHLAALTGFATLAGESPKWLPHALHKADETPAIAAIPASTRVMQQVVGQVGSGYAPSGTKGQRA